MKPLTYATVCSGIECMSAACLDLPMRPVFFSEIEPFPCAVLQYRFPHVPNLGDMSKIHITEKGEITNDRTTVTLPAGGLDVLAGGTPCQDVSAAGKRRGMEEGSGTRSSLAFEFVRLIRELRPRYVVWENVAGVLTDPSFPQFLRAIADCGYGVAYRTLDAQYVRCADIDLPDGGVVRLERAVPQRRRRVWAVGCAGGDVGKASEVLFEHARALGDRPPRRVAGKGPAAAAGRGDPLPGRVVEGAAAIAANLIGFDPYEPGGVKSLNRGHAGTVVNGTCPGSHNAVCEVYENHQTDARVRNVEASPTLGSTRNAQAANNNPLVVETFVKVSHAHGADGEGERWTRVATNSNGGDAMPTISASEYKQVESQKDKSGGYVLERRAYGINPQSSLMYPCTEEVAQTQAVTHQCGVCLGFKQKSSAKALGIGDEREVSPTVTAEFDGAVAAVSVETKQQSLQTTDGLAGTLSATDHKEPQAVICLNAGDSVSKRVYSADGAFAPLMAANVGTGSGTNNQSVLIPGVASMRYLVRRLTPTECERLMGLPDGWTLPAFAPCEVTDALVAEFCAIHDAYGAVMAGYAGKPPPKPKTAAWVRKWLGRIANPETCPDAPRYKACGNGWATNQPRWIILRVLAAEDIDPWDGSPDAQASAHGADVYNGAVHAEVADTFGANSGAANTAGGKVIV